MVSLGMDIHSDKTVCDFFDPTAEPTRQHRTATVPTTQEGLESVLRPFEGRCRVAFEVRTQAQWVAQIIRPLAAEVQVANPSLITWLYRSGRKNDKLDARKLSTLLSLNQLPTVHLPPADVSAWRALINHRRTLVRRRTMIKNQIRAIVRTFAHRCPYRSCWTRIGMVWLRSLTFDAVRQSQAVRQLLWDDTDGRFIGSHPSPRPHLEAWPERGSVGADRGGASDGSSFAGFSGLLRSASPWSAESIQEGDRGHGS